MKQPLYIYGYSDYARLCRHYFSVLAISDFQTFLVDEAYLPDLADVTDSVASIDDPIIRGRLRDSMLFVSIGYSRMRLRQLCFEKARTLGAEMSNCISPQAYIDSTVTLGSNNIVMPGSVIEPFVTLGDNNIIWSNTTICHDSIIGSHNFFAAASVVGGRVSLGDFCFLGFASVVAQGTTVSNETLLGANSTLLDNTGPCEKWLGQPATISGYHHEDGICIQ